MNLFRKKEQKVLCPSENELFKLQVKNLGKELGTVAIEGAVVILFPAGWIISLIVSIIVTLLLKELRKFAYSRGETSNKISIHFEDGLGAIAMYGCLRKALPKLVFKFLKISVGTKGRLVIEGSSMLISTLITMLSNINTNPESGKEAVS